MDPDARIMENEWRKETGPPADAIFYCERCTAENFFDIERARQRQPVNPDWGCGWALENPPRMRLGAEHDPFLVVLSRGAQLFPHHLERDNYNLGRALAEVTANPFWLRNLSSNSWVCRAQDNSITVGCSDEVLPLRVECYLSFGRIEAEVRLKQRVGLLQRCDQGYAGNGSSQRSTYLK